MKRLFIVLGVAASVQFTYAQKSVYTERPNRLFTQGKEMFLDKNYAGCLNSLKEFKEQSTDLSLIQEAEYMIISSLFYQGKAGTENILKEYLDTYPETYHRNQLSFFIGTVHFEQKDWQKALYWLSQSDVDYLTIDEQEDYSYRAAYANLQVGSRADAKSLFGLLTRNSRKYSEPSSYYLAYINFQDKEYDQALPVFRKLKNRPEYKEDATLFLVQGAFVQKQFNEVISEGQDFINSFPNSKNTGEVYRMLGSSYYQNGNINNAVRNYEQYLQTASEPLREDMFQLGDSYYQLGNYTKAAEVLRNSASVTDEIGQASNMLLGQSLLKLNQSSGALLAFDAAARTSYNKAISEEALYNFVMLTNRESVSAFGQSITAFQRFLTEYPNSKYSDDINSALASTLLSTKNYKMALEAIGRIKTPGKQVLDAKQTILYQLGVQEFVDGDYDTAAGDFNAAINLGNYNTAVRNEAYFWRGETAYRKGDYKAASRDYVSYIGQAASSQKNYPMALYGLAYTDFQTKNYSAALRNFLKYVSAEKDRQSVNYPDALNRLGDCYLYTRNFSEAERYYSQAISANPSNADYSEFQKAFVLGLQRNYNGKVSALNSMMSKYPNSQFYDNALFEKSRALVMLNKESEAISVLEKLLKEYPKSNLAQKAGVQLGQLYFNTNNSQKAIESYKAAISNNPNSEEARAAIQNLEGVYKDVNDISSYASFVNSLGGGTILTATRQDSLTYLAAENVYMKGKKAEAKTALTKYLQSYSKGVFVSDANFYLGSIAFEAKDNVSALEYFKKVILSNNPKYIDDALIIVSGIEFDNKNYESAYEAYEHLNQVASSTDNRDIAQLGMLRSAYLMKKDNDVIAAANKLLETKKMTAEVESEARFYRGQSLRNVKRDDEAIKDLTLVAKNTRSVLGAESQYLLADIYYNKKSYDKAESQVLSFMKEGTSHEYWMAKAVIVLADVYKAKGDKFQARQYLESLQANYKGSEQDIADGIAQRLAALSK